MMIVMMSLTYHLLVAVVSSVVCVVCVLAMQWSPVSLSCKYNNRATPTYTSYNAHSMQVEEQTVQAQVSTFVLGLPPVM